MLVARGGLPEITDACCICKPVVADDTNVFSLLLFVAQRFENTVFCQGKVKLRDLSGITYHNIKSVSIATEISEILPSFNALAGSDYMNPLFVKTKIQSSERMVSAPSLVSLLSSMKSENVDIPAGIKFIFQIIYSRAKRRR